MLDNIRKRIAAFVQPSAPTRTNLAGRSSNAARMYQNAQGSRLNAGWNPGNTSADSEIVSSLGQLRSRSRALSRDVSYAVRAKTLVINNVVGSGMGMQAQVYTTRDELAKSVNSNIETTWEKWCAADSSHTGGRLHFSGFERALMGQVFEAGEVFVRKHYRKFGNSQVPFSLELIEAERIADDLAAIGRVANGNQIRMGVEVDEFFRPVAYYIRKYHQNELRLNSGAVDHVERVPADQIIHLCVGDRWPMTRGVPWMHPVIMTFKDMDGYVEAEITRARVQACTAGAITTPEDANSLGEEQTDGSVLMELQPGVYQRLNPGESLVAGPNNSPNPAIEPFMRYLLRNVAAGIGVSYESLSRDYSQSNYSSSRLALLDDRDLWRVLQSWFINNFRTPIHNEWLKQAVLAGAIQGISVAQYALDPAKFEAVRFRPRGWGWVDPTKEVEAFKAAVRAGFMTVQDVVSQSGADFEELVDQRKKEVELTAEADLVFDTDPAQVASNGALQADPLTAGKPPDPPLKKTEDDSEQGPPERAFSIVR
jgi:lambda family phage portal protein